MNSNFSRVARRSAESAAIASFGDGVFERLRLYMLLMARSLLHILARRPEGSLFTLRGCFIRNGVRFSFTFMSHDELMLFHEIFCEAVYHLPLDIPPAYVLDLGANIGLSTLYLHTEFPEARIIAVEPNPALGARLDLVSVRIPNVTAVSAAVAGVDGPQTLHVWADTTVGSSLVARGGHSRSISVPGMTIATLMHTMDIPTVDHVKFDIEGAEYDVCSAFSLRGAVQSITGEVHEDLMGRSLAEFEALWPGMQFETIAMRKPGRFLVYGKRT